MLTFNPTRYSRLFPSRPTFTFLIIGKGKYNTYFSTVHSYDRYEKFIGETSRGVLDVRKELYVYGGHDDDDDDDDDFFSFK